MKSTNLTRDEQIGRSVNHRVLVHVSVDECTYALHM